MTNEGGAAGGSWWTRNWKWALPAGLFGGVVVAVGLLAAFLWLFMSFMKSSDVYREAVNRVRTDAFAVREIGEPIETGWFVTGNIRVSESSAAGSSGEADLAIPVYGSLARGTIQAVASKEAGVWTFTRLRVSLPNGRIDVLHGGNGYMLPED